MICSRALIITCLNDIQKSKYPFRVVKLNLDWAIRLLPELPI